MDLEFVHSLLPLIIILGIVLAGIYYFWGMHSNSEVLIGNYEQHDCSDRVNVLSQEYGNSTVNDQFFLDGNDIYLIGFNSSWEVPFSGENCRIIEEENLSKSIFQISHFKRDLSQIDDDFFGSTRDCINIAAAKGASNVCDITGLGEQILNFPVSQVVVKIPTQDSQSLAKALLGRGWSSTVKDGVELVKAADENLGIYLDVVDQSSCSLKDTPKKAIWDLVDYGNQIVTKAKANQFDIDTIPKLISTSELIKSFEGLNVELTIPDTPPPSDIWGIPGFLIQLIINIISFLVKTTSQVTLDTATVLTQPQCNSDVQIAKFQGFENKLESNDFIADYTLFNTELIELKNNASEAMQNEEIARNSNGPSSLTQFLLVKKVIQFYLFEGSQSQQLFNDQLYVSARTAANLKAGYYQNYWNNVSILDVILSFVIWAILIILVLGSIALIVLFIEHNQPHT